MPFYVQKNTMHCMNCHTVIARKVHLERKTVWKVGGNYCRVPFKLSDDTYTNIHLCADCSYKDKYDIAKIESQLIDDFKLMRTVSALSENDKNQHYNKLEKLKIKNRINTDISSLKNINKVGE